MRVSLDGRGRCMDNLPIERMQCSLKREAVKLQELAVGFETPDAIDDGGAFYVRVWTHSTWDNVIRLVVEARTR